MNTYSFPTDPIQWAEGHQCPDCADHPTGICDLCAADMADSDAELAADGRRDEA